MINFTSSPTALKPESGSSPWQPPPALREVVRKFNRDVLSEEGASVAALWQASDRGIRAMQEALNSVVETAQEHLRSNRVRQIPDLPPPSSQARTQKVPPVDAPSEAVQSWLKAKMDLARDSVDQVRLTLESEIFACSVPSPGSSSVWALVTAAAAIATVVVTHFAPTSVLFFPSGFSAVLAIFVAAFAGAWILAGLFAERVLPGRLKKRWVACLKMIRRCRFLIMETAESSRSWHQSELNRRVADLRAAADELCDSQRFASMKWDSPGWQSWGPASSGEFGVRFATLHPVAFHADFPGLDIGGIAGIRLPVLTPFSQSLSLAWVSEKQETAVKAVKSLVLRLLANTPPGRVRFTFIDPVALGGNVASLMSRHDGEDSPVNTRAWTEPRHIVQRLATLAEQVDRPRPDWGTPSSEYTVHQFVIVFDFPSGFDMDATRHLLAIAQRGAPHGVHLVLLVDGTASPPPGFSYDVLRRHLLWLQPEKRLKGDKHELLSLPGKEFERWVLTLDDPPNGEISRRILEEMGRRSSPSYLSPPTPRLPAGAGASPYPSPPPPSYQQVPPPPAMFADPAIPDLPPTPAARTTSVSVPVPPVVRELVATPPPSQISPVAGRPVIQGRMTYADLLRLAGLEDRGWKESSADGLEIPIGGRAGGKAQMLVLGKGTSSHGLITGPAGSGKSRLLSLIVTTLALKHSPLELQFNLVDFDSGGGFTPYARERLPNASAIAVTTEREVAMRVLDRIETELRQRGNLFKNTKAIGLAHCRSLTGENLPRIILAVDEFQRFFMADDGLARRASTIISQLVLHGHKYGMHLLVAAPSLANVRGFSQELADQMGVRITLPSSVSDAGYFTPEEIQEAVYINKGGLIETKSRFKVAAFDPESDGLTMLHTLRQWSQSWNQNWGVGFEPPSIFESTSSPLPWTHRSPEDILKSRSPD